MTSLTHPADYSVAELKDALEAVDDVEELERLLEDEREGENRVTATEAIEHRLDAVDDDDRTDADVDADDHEHADETATDDDSSTESVDDTAAEADDDADLEDPASSPVDADAAVDDAEPGDEVDPVDDDGGPIEETWSKQITARSDAAAASDDRERGSGSVGAAGDDDPAGDGDAMLDSLGLSAEQVEALSANLDAPRDETAAQRPPKKRERLRFSFDDAPEAGGRVEARIRQLQTEVSDLKAYTNALEEFLDEEGTGRQVIESIRSDIASLEDDVADLTNDIQLHEHNFGKFWGVIGDVENELSRLDERVDRQRRNLDDVAATVETLGTDLDALRRTADERHEERTARFEGVDETLSDHAGTLDELTDEVGTVSDRVDAVASDVRTLDADVDDRFDEGSEDRAALAERIDDNADAIEELASRVDDIAATADALEQTVGDSGRIDQRFETMEAEIQTLQAWREQLSSVILGSSGGEADAAEE